MTGLVGLVMRPGALRSMKNELFDPLASEEGPDSFCFIAKNHKTILSITDDILKLPGSKPNSL